MSGPQGRTRRVTLLAGFVAALLCVGVIVHVVRESGGASSSEATGRMGEAAGGMGGGVFDNYESTDMCEPSAVGPFATGSLFDQTAERLKIAEGKDKRFDAVEQRTRDRVQLFRRPHATDNAPFDALRPAFDASCAVKAASCMRRASALQGEPAAAVPGQGAAAAVDPVAALPDWARVVRDRLSLWTPTVQAFMRRPTLVCISTVFTESRLENGLRQWATWGRDCDDFFVAVGLPPATMDHLFNHTTETTNLRARAAALLERYQLPASRLLAVRPPISWKSDLPEGTYDSWQYFRELSRVLGDQPRSSSVFHAEFTLYVRDDAYVSPINAFHFVNLPEVQLYQQLGVPLLLGNVFRVPDGPSADAAASEPRLYPSAAGGIIWNRLAFRLFRNFVRAQEHTAFANTAAHDVLLADAFRYYGVRVIDTADVSGADRQHALNPELATLIGENPSAAAVYSVLRARPSLQGPRAISRTSFVFGGLDKIEDMDALHLAATGRSTKV